MQSVITQFNPFFLNSCIPNNQCNLSDSKGFLRFVYGNTGNSYITYAILRQLGTTASYLTQHNALPNMAAHRLSTAEAERINHTHSHVLLTLQDHMRADWSADYFTHALHNLNALSLPVIAYSLGANSFSGFDNALHTRLSEPCVRFFKTLSERCKTIAVRGDYTADILSKLGITNITITGCPSFFIRRQHASFEYQEWNDKKIVGATGLFAHKDKEQLYYYLQDEKLFGKAIHFDDEFTAEDIDYYTHLLHNHNDYCSSILHALTQRRVCWFSDMSKWEKHLTEHVNFSIGTRVHGAIAALNANIPAIVTNSDARAKEMCNLFGIPQMPNKKAQAILLRELYQDYDSSSMQRAYGPLYQQWQAWMQQQGIEQDALNKILPIAPTFSLAPIPINKSELRVQTLMAIEQLFHSTRPTSIGQLLRANRFLKCVWHQLPHQFRIFLATQVAKRSTAIVARGSKR